MAEVLCPICGRPNGDHREFCDFCGNPLDGALRVEGGHPPLGDDLLNDQPLESNDDESRLESLLSEPEEEIRPSRLEDYQETEPLNGDSRLESLLGSQDDLSPQTTRQDPGPTMPLNGESRLDDYLPVDKPTSDLEQTSEEIDDSSRLGSYLTAEQAADALPLDLENLSEDLENGSSRLDDYLQPESPPEEQPAEEVSRLDDLLADDPFTSPDPFQDPPATEPEKEPSAYDLELNPFEEPPAGESQPSPWEEEPDDKLSFSRDAFLADSPAQQPAQEPEPEPDLPIQDPSPGSEETSTWDFLEPTPTTPEEKQSPDTLDPEAWDFLKPTPDPEQTPEEQPPESPDPDAWDLLDPTPTPEQPDVDKPFESPEHRGWDLSDPASTFEDSPEEQPQESADLETWDFLDPSGTSEKPAGEQTQDSADPGEWDFLDPTPTSEEPRDTISPESIDPGEWEYLDPAPTMDPSDQQAPAEPVNGGEWDFLDPSATTAPSTEPSPTEERDPSQATDAWSFLDPGPTDDLSGETGTQDYPSEESGEDAGWLDMLQDPETRKRLEEESALPEEPQKPQTDWLDKIKRLNKSSDLVDEDSSFPDWLSVTGKTPEIKGKGAEGDGSSDDVPDWLHLDDDESLNEFLRKKDLTNEEYKPKVTTDSLDSDEIPAEEDAPAAELSDSQQIKFPSWAEEQKKKTQKPQVGQGKEEPQKGSPEPTQPFQMEEEYFDDLFSEELPGWLTATSSSEAEKTIGQNLAQGELPGWVEAMRPVVESSDASGLDEDEDYIENYGPLAGIPSVLPAEAEIGINVDQAAEKPLDLLATKKHKDYVDLLKKLIDDEDQSVTIQVPPRLQTQRILRWLIAILMVVSIAVTVIFSGTLESDPLTASQLAGTGISALYDEIETLYDGQPVLIAYDYQPAAAGELHIAAATVVDHLMEQGTFLTFISTQPTGPALAEHFLETTQSHHQYKHTQKYINLGYLPGESAGLLSFTIAPKKIIPLAFDGSNAWDSPPLISVDGIRDFKMILVITDDPNTAKIWIEQVGSRLDKTPLVMVVSAQVEPLIQPYFRTSPRQVSGYVAGIIDSMNYEQLTERPYLASRSWLPFNIGIVISVGIIFISGLANGVLSLFKRRQIDLTGDLK